MNIKTILSTLGVLAVAALMALQLNGTRALAQEGGFNVPSGTATTNQVMEMQSDGLVRGTSSPSITSATLGSGTLITKIAIYTATVTQFTLAANSCVEKAYTVTGLTTADKIFVNPTFETGAEGFIASARVAAANDLVLVICNPHSVTVDPETGTVNVLAIRS